MYTLKLVLHVEKMKFMLLSNSDSSIVLRTLQGNLITLVSEYKYLGIIIDNTIIFSSHINYLKQKLRQKLGFYFRNKSWFSFYARKKRVSVTFLPILAYGDVVYQHEPSCLLSSSDAVYHGALRVITDCKHLTHDCTLYSRVAWSFLAVRRKMHWYLMICKASFFFTTISLLFDSTKISMYLPMYYNLNVPSARTHLGTKAFKYAALSDWNYNWKWN